MPRTPGGRGGAHLGDDLLVDLAHGLVSREGEEELLAHIARCKRCEERFRRHAAEREDLRAIAGETLLGAPSPVRGAPAAAPRTGRFAAFPLRWGIAGGALAVAAIAAVIFMGRSGRAPGGEAERLLHWLPDPRGGVVTRNSNPSDSDPMFEAGLDAYARHDMRAAAASLARARETGAMEMLRGVYYGSALAWNGDFAQAVDALSGVRAEALPEPWQGEARWTLYVALRGSGAAARADSLLGELARGSGKIAERARAELGPK